MKKLILTAAALAVIATPAVAENMKSSARSLMPFGPDNDGWKGVLAPFPSSRFALGDMDSDSARFSNVAISPSAYRHATFAGMDNDNE